VKETERDNRVWLGWHRAILHSSVDFLATRYQANDLWDMNEVLCVLPSSLAGRRLSELLAERATKDSVVLRPPEILTIGELPEKLYEAKFPFAGDVEQVLAWTKVLRSTSSKVLEPLLVEVPSSASTQPWIELASLISSLHRELSSDLTMFVEVAKKLEQDNSSEAARWQVLAKLQRGYLDELSKSKRWDVQTARMFAIEHQEPIAKHDIIVIGAVDLNEAQRAFLKSVHDRVRILVGAPKSWQNEFDRFGALISSLWQDIPVDFREGQLICRATADQAADEVIKQLALLNLNPEPRALAARSISEPIALATGSISNHQISTRQYTAQEITIGVPDTSMISVLTERLHRYDIVGRNGGGVKATETSPVRLLEGIVDYLEEGTYESFSSLVRLPLVHGVLEKSGIVPRDFLQQIDIYYQATLIQSVKISEWPEARGLDATRQTIEAIDTWLRPLRLPPIALNEWSKPLRNVFNEVFADVKANLDSPEGDALMDATKFTSAAIETLDDLPDAFVVDATLREAIGWIVRQLDKQTVPPLVDPNSIEMIGWLDLTLDDAPVLLLTGIHDGTVPESVNADAFLPNRIRTELGLMDNERRYARDCYAMQVLLHTREYLRVITNHTSATGEPQTPSRLLLAVDAHELASRVLELIEPEAPDERIQVLCEPSPRPVQSDLPIPEPLENAGVAIERMSPSDFESYLQCPYRFYLSRVLRLSPIDDRKMELEANDFGNLIHETLSGMVDSPVAHSSDSEAIQSWLLKRIDEVVRAKYGESLPPAIIVQIEQARQRLIAFAPQQAAQVSSGWKILATEVAINSEHGASLDVDGLAMPLIGRIDRVDYHPELKQLAIWDYKTGDKAKKPKQAHYGEKSGWKNLQLPVYRHLIKVLKWDEQGVAPEALNKAMVLGYINIPKSASECKFEIASFDDGLLKEADEEAAQVIRKIRASVFWPPRYDNVNPWDEFTAICQNDVARRWVREAEATETALEDEAAAHSNIALDETELQVLESTPWKPETLSEEDLYCWHNDGPRKPGLVLDNTSGKTNPDWFQATMIEASAGSGKTFSLAIRMIRLLFARQSPEGILATTFTRKAAGEILERVLKMLAKAIVNKGDLETLRDKLRPMVIDETSCIYHLSELCQNLHRLRVSTLDGFYQTLARSFALELQLPPGWKLADEFQEAKIRELAVTRMFENQNRGELRSLVSQLSRGEARRSVRSEIHQTIDAGYLLYRTSPVEAWNNFPIPKLPDEKVVTVAVHNASIVELPGTKMKDARDKVLRLFEHAQWEELVASTLLRGARTDGKYSRQAIPSGLLEPLCVLFDYALSREFSSRLGQTEAAHQVLAKFHLQFEEVKRTYRMVTFADISIRLADWFNRRFEKESKSDHVKTEPTALATGDRATNSEKNLKQIDYRLDSPIKHLLLDEFQDTAPAQWDILRPFAEAVTMPRGNQMTSFFCVGDVKQAIYGWRGGVAELFKVVQSHLKSVKGDTLAVSYRSSPIVIDFVNYTFSHLLDHENLGAGQAASEIWSLAFPTHDTTRASMAGFVQIKNISQKQMDGRTGGDEEVEVDADEDIIDCVSDIASLHRSAPEVEIGVLVRANHELGPLINLLREQGIDASQEGGNPLTDSAAIELILSLIQLADHPGDRLAQFHLANSPLAGPLFGKRPAVEVAGSKLTLDRIAAERVAMAVRKRIDDFGYGRTIAHYVDQLLPSLAERDQLRADQLIQRAYHYDGMSTLRGRDFIDFVRKDKVSLNRPAKVRVMTIHQSKGLEFDAVFLPGLHKAFRQNDTGFVTRQASPTEPPQSIIRYMNANLQEHLTKEWREAFDQKAIRGFSEALCTFYVALTRARQALYLYARPSAKPVQTWGSLLNSVFVDESKRNAANEIVYQRGDEGWFSSSIKDEASEKAESQVDLINQTPKSFLRIRLPEYCHGGVVRQRRSLKPSAAHEARIVSLKNVFAKDESVGAIVGTLVHRWFEEITWLDEFAWNRKKMKSLALQTLSPKQMPLVDVDELLDQMEGHLNLKSVSDGLMLDRYCDWVSTDGSPLTLQVTKERRLLELVDDSLLRGTIDRLVIGYDHDQIIRAEILDYKTDAFHPKQSVEAWVRDRVEHHADQLRLYRRVLSQQFKIDPERVQLTLLLLSVDRAVTFS
jgi:ATP-dependent exoDNAse (exonuclease V) beta subunit